MENILKIAIIGLGNRGRETYGAALTQLPEKAKIVAVAEILPDRLEQASKEFNLPKEMCFESAEEFLKHPKVKILGHCDDVKYPVDYEALMVAAKFYNVIFEINNSSLSPNGYRGDTRENVRTILRLCKKYNHPIVLSSDSHGRKNVGNFEYAMKMIEETDFPEDLILNYSSKKFKSFIAS